ncbi:uncharacterized protein LOC123678197 [Harmonia axyridis]|uniref:uncharacterized protein LOC123678197 n=1 Tax=Harmonia axyridis TaxID=115357 RepID=UPI001E2756A4|nr:uncharacterized protein LOC123678197 [Harmonia axyridis]
MCAMKFIIQICVFIIFELAFCSSIFVVNNSISILPIDDNPARWTEEGIWGPILEDWVLGSKREKRVMRIDNNEIMIVRRIDSDDKDRKESKIYNTKIVNNSNYKPPRQVSETDLYLLSAIEKLVYKVDSMEKRLRKAEEMLYYFMAGNRIDQDQCPDNFTRIGENCYFFGNKAGREYDWKAASKQCRILNSVLAEFETIEENQDIISYIQNNDYLRGKDFWTGGLNPGLLWIWSNSARPVSSGKNQQKTSISGDGRCLRMAFNPQLRSYAYKGSDCSIRYNYICEISEDPIMNEIQKQAKSKEI